MYKQLIVILVFSLLYLNNKSEANDIDYSLCFYEGELSKSDFKVISDWLSVQHKTLGIENDLLVSQCAMSVGDKNKSLEFLNFVFDKDPKNIEALKIKSKLLFSARDLKGAEKILSSLYQTDAMDLEDIILLCAVLNDLGDYNKSLKILSKELIKNNEKLPIINSSGTRVSLDEIALYMKKSEIEFANGKVEDSINTLKEGFSRNNGSIELFDTLMFVLQNINNRELADSYIAKNCSESLIQESKYCQ